MDTEKPPFFEACFLVINCGLLVSCGLPSEDAANSDRGSQQQYLVFVVPHLQQNSSVAGQGTKEGPSDDGYQTSTIPLYHVPVVTPRSIDNVMAPPGIQMKRLATKRV